MAIACITPVVAAKMKQAIRDGEINIKDLYEMTSEQRRGVFGKYVDGELSRFINVNFEKAIISKQKDALQKWVNTVFKPAEVKGDRYKSVLDKIESLKDMGALTPAKADAFLADLVAEKMGITLTLPEVKEIESRANRLQDLHNLSDKFGNPPVEYWMEHKSMQDYINGLNPSHQLKVATSIIGRGTMLASAKSPVTNIISNTVNATIQAFERRLTRNTYKGLNNDLAVEYVKSVNEIYQKSGYDISRMESYGGTLRGEEVPHAQGPGVIRKVGRFFEDTVFKQLMGAPDVASASVAFADTANLASTAIAKGDKAKAREIMLDAMRIKPQTIPGEIVRAQAMAQAAYTTYTNKGGFAEFSLGIRNVLNSATGDIRLGDQLMPFVKTPANVVQAGVDASGVRFLEVAWKLKGALDAKRLGDSKPLQEVSNLAIRSGLGMTLALVVANMFKPDDFVGAFDSITPAQRNLARAKNAPFNSVRIGGKWISLDYFGPLAAPIVGFLYAKKYGTSIPSGVGMYVKGVIGQSLNVPGMKEFASLVDGISQELNKTGADVAKGLTDQAIGYIRSRTIPALLSDLAIGTDKYQRKTGTSAIDKVKAGIPGARQTLPVRTNIEGAAKLGEGFISTLLFGSRVTTAEQSGLVKEISRLTDAGEAPIISDHERSSKRVKELKAQISPDKYEKAIQFNGEMFSRIANRVIKSGQYVREDDSGKKKLIDNARNDALDMMLVRFRYRKPRPKRS